MTSSLSCTPLMWAGSQMSSNPYQNLFDEESIGHIAEIRIDAARDATLVPDQAFIYCSETGDVTASIGKGLR